MQHRFLLGMFYLISLQFNLVDLLSNFVFIINLFIYSFPLLLIFIWEGVAVFRLGITNRIIIIKLKKGLKSINL